MNELMKTPVLKQGVVMREACPSGNAPIGFRSAARSSARRSSRRPRQRHHQLGQRATWPQDLAALSGSNRAVQRQRGRGSDFAISQCEALSPLLLGSPIRNPGRTIHDHAHPLAQPVLQPFHIGHVNRRDDIVPARRRIMVSSPGSRAPAGRPLTGQATRRGPRGRPAPHRRPAPRECGRCFRSRPCARSGRSRSYRRC